MKNIKITFGALSLLIIKVFFACKDEKAAPELVIMKTELIDLDKDGEEQYLLVKSNTDWTAASAGWIIVSPASGSAATTKVTITVISNNGEDRREGTVIFSAGTANQTIHIVQRGQGAEVPENNEGMVSDAATLAGKINVGWNLGNSLESIADGVPSETVWGNPATSKRLIDSVKAAGFNAVRIPCAWNGYIENETTYKIKNSWLDRVKQVVDYCIDNEMYVVLNIHWDGGWLQEHPYYRDTASVYPKQHALWTQIADYFKDYGELLLFAGTNEVNNGQGENPSSQNLEVQQAFNQIFVDAVRATGGKNSWRNLVIQSYNTNIDLAERYLRMPEDKVARRLMLEVHFYDPYDFTLAEAGYKTVWGKYFTGNDLQERHVADQFAKMRSKFVSRGTPVIIGEYGSSWRGNLPNHIAARNYYLNYVTRTAKNNGLIPFYWDNGGLNIGSSGLFNRATGAQAFRETIKMITDWQTEYVPQ